MIVPAAPTASAATARNGICETGEFCLYYGADETGSVSDFSGSIPNYGGSNVTYNPGGAGNLGSLTRENASHLFEPVS